MEIGRNICSRGWEAKIERIKDWIDIGEKEEKIIIGGLNARMGEEC